MTDKELKKNIKKIGIISLSIIIIIIVLTIYILGFHKAELSVCNADEYENDLRMLGIDETEFKEYLSIFANYVDFEESNNVTNLDTVTGFIDKMTAVNQEEFDSKSYDASVIDKVAEELNGSYIEKDIDANEKYSYDLQNNLLIKNVEENQFPSCKEIKEVVQNGEKIEVEYIVEKDGKDKKIKAVIMKNNNYEYSKYFLVSIK